MTGRNPLRGCRGLNKDCWVAVGMILCGVVGEQRPSTLFAFGETVAATQIRMVGSAHPTTLKRSKETLMSIEIVNKDILRHANLTTQIYLGNVPDTEAMRWICG